MLLLKIGQCLDGLVRFGRHKTNLGNAVHVDGMVKPRGTRSLLTGICQRAGRYEKRWACLVVTRGEHLDRRTSGQPWRTHRPGRERERLVRRRCPPKTDADRTPATGAPEHTLAEFLSRTLQFRRYANLSIGPHQLQVGIGELHRNGCGALSVVVVITGDIWKPARSRAARSGAFGETMIQTWSNSIEDGAAPGAAAVTSKIRARAARQNTLLIARDRRVTLVMVSLAGCPSLRGFRRCEPVGWPRFASRVWELNLGSAAGCPVLSRSEGRECSAVTAG